MKVSDVVAKYPLGARLLIKTNCDEFIDCRLTEATSSYARFSGLPYFGEWKSLDDDIEIVDWLDEPPSVEALRQSVSIWCERNT